MKQRTFHVGPAGATRPIVLRSTSPKTWRAPDGALFVHFGHAWLGQPGRRYRVERWSAPHTDRTFTSLQSAVTAWDRAMREKQVSAEVDKVLGK